MNDQLDDFDPEPSHRPSFTDRLERGLGMLEGAARELGAAAVEVSAGTGVRAILQGNLSVLGVMIRGVRGWLGRG